MEKNFTRLAMSLTLAASLFALSSCGGFMGVDSTDQKSIDDNLRKNIEKFVQPEASVLEIKLLPNSTGSDFTMTLGSAVVAHFAPNDDEFLYYNIMLGGMDKDEPTKAYGAMPALSKRKPESGMKLKDIDFSKIASNIQQGVEFMKENEFACDGVGHYRIVLDSDPAKVVHEFELESIDGKDYGTKNGRTTVTTNYYKFEFQADPDGNVTYIE